MTSARRGMSLIEVMVAISILSVVLASLGALSFQLARRSLSVAGTTQRNGIMAQQVNRLLAAPFDSLPGDTGTTTVAAPPLPHTRRIVVADTTTGGATVRRVMVVITPTSGIVRPDTQQFQRARTAASPFQ